MIKTYQVVFALTLMWTTLTASPTPPSFEPLTQPVEDSLRSLYGKNIKNMGEYEQQFLIALSHYPELANVPIEVHYSKEKTTMTCRPKYCTLCKKQRSYIITINNKNNFEGVHLAEVPFNAQVGIIGHELAHIVDYEQRSTGNIIKLGFKYQTDDKFKREYERSIDLLTVRKGLGNQLLDWADFSMFQHERLSDSYKEYKMKFYMKPEEIASAMAYQLAL